MQTYQAGTYDVIVVGGGHAGSEASLAAARMGMNTLLVTLNIDMIAFMPCNPSVGGPAKGVVVREIDALGGEMGRNVDKTYIQMRMLNTGKGPAVRALRAQTDKDDYAKEMRKTLEKQENLTIKQATVEDLMIEDNQVKGVITQTGAIYQAKAVILTTGTAARGEIIIGDLKYSSGPNNSQAAERLTANLADKYDFDITRFKTGTPPRIDKASIDYSKTEIQPGDKDPHHFSFMSSDQDYLDYDQQVPCYLTYTNEETHRIIRDNLERAPMFTGIVEGVGARYCPSIEDKVVRFADKPKHQIFLEPEGRDNEEIYVQGLSTSLPEDVQVAMLQTVAGLEQARIMRDGYAIEYDVVRPHQLKATLETKAVANLYTAGQTNGTSGYEEAAGQGLVAGINAALKIQGREPFILGRDEAYIGVMIDDLVTKGTTEPYRLLTSRAEYRLLLRHDNADLRLTEKGYQLGLVTDDQYQSYLANKKAVEAEIERLTATRLKPSSDLQDYLADHHSAQLKDGILAADLLKRPELSIQDILKFAPTTENYPRQVYEQVEIQIKYAGYIKKAEQNVDRLHRMEAKQIPEDIDWDAIESLATEARERLKEINPRTLAQASRVSGVNPADISVLMVYLKSGRVKRLNQ
ncbi:tRNA uridine 5-carboxymethylaminomethyl modification protein [Aerococcus urinaehominis]|uniref:tRNA uridine 5-carboxymethylaminomethyl modification enzyme MnmG n=1 Tax=Aerococcus urinaehominis TaxID=128944 RepID=A0A0X8FL61_9LACT|nr:tRNA uridine-5-carboxymethylaminomethyl(34) synthesis enzyme MnmG [Aerococcus urinaehominis]AMB99343.1 tRNA uridine 5-carboxymethylaminomethyl modification protein [Aerococcus urinaehominis]SDM58417.1 tRNA uridine 5-carboxymethylaminomethyl modification enzyme [Aerococcus urinaehominis]